MGDDLLVGIGDTRDCDIFAAFTVGLFRCPKEVIEFMKVWVGKDAVSSRSAHRRKDTQPDPTIAAF
jgi:hypothetical protein